MLADGCGHLVDRMLVYPGTFDLFAAWSIAVGFGLQIYFDFAAYTHMAIGVSLLLGVRLQENFLAPYQADSIREFWRRWHVTLSRWFRDYLYIPLGGSRVAGVRTVFNLLVTFLLCGLWHGAGLNFLFWGLMHGLYLGIFHTKQRIIPNWSLPHPLAVLLTFAAVSFAWVPFRVDDMFTVVKIWSGMVGVYGVGMLLSGGRLRCPNVVVRWAFTMAGRTSVNQRSCFCSSRAVHMSRRRHRSGKVIIGAGRLAPCKPYDGSTLNHES